MPDKLTDQSYMAAHQANEQLGHVKVITADLHFPFLHIGRLLSTSDGTTILNKYESDMKDGLTGLLNKKTWELETKRFFDYCLRNKKPFCIFYIDVNDFKKINDTYSHQTGNEVLKLISSGIKDSIRETDLAGRVGGDEFAVGLPDADYKSAKIVRDRINFRVVELVNASLVKDMALINPSITIGLHTSVAENDTFESVLKEADSHMQELKMINNHGR